MMIKYRIRKIAYDTYAVEKKFLFWWIRDNNIKPQYDTQVLLDYIEKRYPFTEKQESKIVYGVYMPIIDINTLPKEQQEFYRKYGKKI